MKPRPSRKTRQRQPVFSAAGLFDLRKLATDWRKSAAWYRRGGFTKNDEVNCARREAIAETLDNNAATLRRIIRSNAKLTP